MLLCDQLVLGAPLMHGTHQPCNCRQQLSGLALGGEVGWMTSCSRKEYADGQLRPQGSLVRPPHAQIRTSRTASPGPFHNGGNTEGKSVDSIRLLAGQDRRSKVCHMAGCVGHNAYWGRNQPTKKHHSIDKHVRPPSQPPTTATSTDTQLWPTSRIHIQKGMSHSSDQQSHTFSLACTPDPDRHTTQTLPTHPAPLNPT